ncbi:hypothetical protein GDO86_020492 [Hymenochirus boettgeri]|uniref:Pyrin domain-containing protein n=1 Tax=Hymenochirus boettgeri TaxID=247094 RepID=A0A8T2IK19_9PIPI|nr:hypothetical protein GDO86_020492 [Hymenochirus boettgeri]
MVKTVRDALVDALDNLSKEAFKKFKEKLNDPGAQDRIPWGQLQDADTGDVATKMIRFYTESMAITVTIQVLEGIKELDAIKKLQESLTDNARPPIAILQPTSQSQAERPERREHSAARNPDTNEQYMETEEWPCLR